MTSNKEGIRKRPDNSRPLSYVLLKKYGAWGALSIIRRDVLFDYINKVDTFRPVSNKVLFSAEKQAEQNRYVPSTFALLETVISHTSQWVAPKDCQFLDIGSGKAKALISMAGYPFMKLTGIEFSTKLHDIARQNIETLGLESRVQLFNSDAAIFEPAALDRVIYFFNPFTGSVLHRCLKNICSSPATGKKYIIYVNPTESHVFEQYFDKLEECVFQPGSVEVNFYMTR